MQLKIQRSQRAGGMLANKVIFCLDVRVQYSEKERGDINRYKLGREVVYSSRAQQQHFANMQAHADRMGGGAKEAAAGLGRGLISLALAKMNLSITIASLESGQHIECQDLSELMEAEEAVMQACRNLKDYLRLAASFSGSVVLIDFEEGEKEHVSSAALTVEASISPHQPSKALPAPAQVGEFHDVDTKPTYEASAAPTLARDEGQAFAFVVPQVDVERMLASITTLLASVTGLRGPSLFVAAGLAALLTVIIFDTLFGLGITVLLALTGLAAALYIWRRR